MTLNCPTEQHHPNSQLLTPSETALRLHYYYLSGLRSVMTSRGLFAAKRAKRSVPQTAACYKDQWLLLFLGGLTEATGFFGSSISSFLTSVKRSPFKLTILLSR